MITADNGVRYLILSILAIIYVLYSNYTLIINNSPVLAGASPMNTNNERYTSCNTLLTVILLFAMACVLPAARATPFTPPELEGFNLHDERDADGDGDGKNETQIRHYLNANGDSLASFTSNERIWAWSLDTRDSEIGSENYVIRDSNCDGTFDEVYGLDDEFHVPDCVKGTNKD